MNELRTPVGRLFAVETADVVLATAAFCYLQPIDWPSRFREPHAPRLEVYPSWELLQFRYYCLHSGQPDLRVVVLAIQEEAA